VVITVHAPLPPSSDADALTVQAQAVIESALQPQFHAPKGGAASDE